MTEVKLPSGAILKITPAPFAKAKALLQSILDEGLQLKLDMKQDIDGNFLKDIFCLGLSSKKIEAALGPCLERALYNNLKIDENTFDPVDARQDYFPTMYEVAKENVLPFTKSLYAEFSRIVEKLGKDPA